MARSADQPSPQDLVKHGLIQELSMADYSPEQTEAVAATQPLTGQAQGGADDRFPAAQPIFGYVPPAFNAGKPTPFGK